MPLWPQSGCILLLITKTKTAYLTVYIYPLRGVIEVLLPRAHLSTQVKKLTTHMVELGDTPAITGYSEDINDLEFEWLHAGSVDGIILLIM